jgi:hypothetical protein
MEAGIINVREMMDDMSGRVLLSNWRFWGIDLAAVDGESYRVPA